jgi:hypothetical protein
MAGMPDDTETPFAWEGLDYIVDVTAAEHERILAIRDQLPSPGLDAALARRPPPSSAAALRAHRLRAGARRSRRRGDPQPRRAHPPRVRRPPRRPGRGVAWHARAGTHGHRRAWHVAGSLLGLDLALARSALRHLSVDDMPAIPTVNLNDQMTLARTAVAFATHRVDAAPATPWPPPSRAAAGPGAERRTNPEAVLALADELA